MPEGDQIILKKGDIITMVPEDIYKKQSSLTIPVITDIFRKRLNRDAGAIGRWLFELEINDVEKNGTIKWGC